ncbi:MAG: hypothetical protein K2X81_25765 [Candidatus Obscuribacterales bacterium]|nr:hypothetical protein [Candidatus Obscuribacterales bacterium]
MVEAEHRLMEDLNEEEINYIANNIQKANKTKAFLLYVAFVIFPVALCQYWVGVGVLALAAALFLALNPDFGRPSRPEVIEIIETEPDTVPPLPPHHDVSCNKHVGIEPPKQVVVPQDAQTYVVSDPNQVSRS